MKKKIKIKQQPCKGGSRRDRWLAGILQLRGLGKDLWKGEDPDEYVRRLRENWNTETQT
ncbi:MAG TPA: hypothetical protein VGV35_01760 [Bryobacteraceae bacterium]|nr:hypothetical protein [Bryobacteraceae bacterium]